MTLDRLVVVRSAGGGLMVATPGALATVIFSDQEDPSQGLLALAALAVAIGFWLSGFVAGLDATDQPERHGQAAALLAFVLVEVIVILGRLDRGATISVPSFVILAVVAFAGGTYGARQGARRRTRRHTT